jgi:hypothetical protein
MRCAPGSRPLSSRATQLLEREALALERAQQLEAGGARRIVAQPVEQSLGLEVDRNGHIVAVSNPGCAVRTGS